MCSRATCCPQRTAARVILSETRSRPLTIYWQSAGGRNWLFFTRHARTLPMRQRGLSLTLTLSDIRALGIISAFSPERSRALSADARVAALDDVRKIMALPIRRKVIENPRGAIGSMIAKPTQVVQPYEFGDDASKATCLWMLDKDGQQDASMRLPIDPAKRVQGRIVNGVERWANQTDTGQNRLSPGADRWKERSRTYPGIADAIAAHLG